MTNSSSKKRKDSASRIIRSTPQRIYKALVDPDALVSWLPPKGMIGRIIEFDPRAGGPYRMSLTYTEPDDTAQGKTTEHTDVVNGKFLELIPDERIVQAIQFQSDDPAFAGEMTMTWTMTAVPGGTEVTVVCDNVPEGIRKEDHDVGLRSSLDNLAEHIE